MSALGPESKLESNSEAGREGALTGDSRSLTAGLLRVVGRTLLRAGLLACVALALCLALLRQGAPPIEQVIGGRGADAEARAQIRRVLDADQPFLSAWLATVAAYSKADFGRSWRTGARIGPELRVRLGRSLALVLPGVLLGQIWAWRSAGARRLSGFFESASWFVVAAGLVVFATALQWLLSSPGGLNWLPLHGMPASFGADWLWHLLLPTLTLGLFAYANAYPALRALFEQTAAQSFVLGARARGTPGQAKAARARAMRGTAGALLLYRVPLLAFAAMMVLEQIYGVPGFGEWLSRAVLDGDRPVVLAVTFVLALLFALLKVAEQVWLQWADPRALDA